MKKTPVSPTDIIELRKSSREAMPLFMLNFEVEIMLRETPSPEKGKEQFIKDWICFFDDDSFDEINIKPLVAEYRRHSIKTIEVAFKWTQSHFAELDLGKNIGWQVSRKIAQHISSKNWGEKHENKLIFWYMANTRWFDHRG